MEIPDQVVTVRVSRELLAQMTQGWSPPVQVMITGNAAAGWDMIARTHMLYRPDDVEIVITHQPDCPCADAKRDHDDAVLLRCVAGYQVHLPR